MATVRRYDRGQLKGPENLAPGTRRVSGFAARVGVQVYRDADGSLRRELRLPEEVFHPDSLKSFEGAWMTDGHPPDFVTPDTARVFSRGIVTAPARRDDDMVAFDSVIDDGDMLRKLDDIKASGKHAELSVGYTADFEAKPGDHPIFGRYDGIQRNIRANHIAILDTRIGKEARAGKNARLRLDEAEMVTDEELNAAARAELPADDYAVPGRKALPINDAIHVREAMARFGQEHFSSSTEKRTAYSRIVARAHRFDIDPSGFEKAWSSRLDAVNTSRSAIVKLTDEEIENLKKQLRSVQARCETLETDLRAANARADSAEGSVVALTADIGKLRAGRVDQAELDAAKGKITELTSQLENEKKLRRDATSPDAIGVLVAKRFEIVQDAMLVDPELRVDGMSDRQLMDHTLHKINGTTPAKELSDDFVSGQFKAAVKSHRAWTSALPKVREDALRGTDDREDDGAAEPKVVPQSERWKKPLPNSVRAKQS